MSEQFKMYSTIGGHFIIYNTKPRYTIGTVNEKEFAMNILSTLNEQADTIAALRRELEKCKKHLQWWKNARAIPKE